MQQNLNKKEGNALKYLAPTIYQLTCEILDDMEGREHDPVCQPLDVIIDHLGL